MIDSVPFVTSSLRPPASTITGVPHEICTSRFVRQTSFPLVLS
jgi:hypothetical protein